jgi:hypothetical protein
MNFQALETSRKNGTFQCLKKLISITISSREMFGWEQTLFCENLKEVVLVSDHA